MHEAGFWILFVGFVAFCWWFGARIWRANLEARGQLPEPEPMLAFPPAITPPRARHPRVELEFHAHRHWGVRRERFPNGTFAGWAVHIGFGVGCICIDFFRRGRRP